MTKLNSDGSVDECCSAKSYGLASSVFNCGVCSMPTTDEFADALRNQLQRAQAVGAKFLDINAGELHRKLGGYPNDAGTHHQIPSCCSAMYAEKRSGDTIVAAPPKGKGESLTIRYKLPR